MITEKELGCMNLSTVALILLAWQLLSDGNRQPQQKKTPQIGLSDILSDDVKNVINCAQKLSDKNCSQGDRAGAIFEIMSNPALQNIANSIFGNMGAQNDTTPPHQQTSERDPDVNSEGYRFDKPSADSQEFFRPIDNIADTEVKHKLYWFYDHWYNK